MNSDSSTAISDELETQTDLKPSNTFWKSLGELARNKEYENYLHREFGENASELQDGVSRRSFLRIMGASIGLAGLSACRRPVQKILPFSRQPEDVVLGVPLQYASGFPFQDTLTGILVENNEGRPSKVEGNPEHPSSSGKSSLYQQAAILSLYDPDRSRSILFNGKKAGRYDLVSFAKRHFAERNQRIVFIAEENSSPTLQRLKRQILRQFPKATWVTYEPFSDANVLEGSEIAFGRRLRVVNHYDRADVVVSLDDDFLSPQGHKDSVSNAWKLTRRRKVGSTQDTMNRVYSVESTFTLTGAFSDHRHRIKSSQLEPFTYALAAHLFQKTGSSALSMFSRVDNEFLRDEFLKIIADDLLANRGRSIITAGYGQPAQVHAAAAAINQALGNTGTGNRSTVTLHTVGHYDGSEAPARFAAAVQDIAAGQVPTVVLLGTNPAFTAPADLGFKDALSKASTVIHLSDYVDETSKIAGWHVNRAHFLEAWGDGRSYTGVDSVIQPQIQPLFEGFSDIEFLNLLLTGEYAAGYDLVQQTWRERVGATGFATRWETILHDGLDKRQLGAYEAASASVNTGRLTSAISPRLSYKGVQGLEITIRPDATLFDGRFANNGWLMELPDPMTKITWDNVALMSPKTAKSLGIPTERHLSDQSAPIISITAGGTSIRIPAWIQPGHADQSITLTAGYGRQGVGRVADGVGIDVYPLRTTSESYVREATVTVTDEDYEISCTQAHHSLEGRDMVRAASLTHYKEKPDFASFDNVHGYAIPGLKEAAKTGNEGPISLFTETYGPDYEPQWGMAIDLNACFGCGVCTIACQAENNIPVIGKKEVGRRRIMHWIRTDRYFVGDVDNPQVYHQPVPCMHCELAPCEQVCPVAATTHSADGMNQMTYNRCIGTRYCSNNCPFKVRRFNFFNYTKEYLTTGDDPEIIQMAMNPEVTVRFRGVMEKCTYCVQRVNREKIETKKRTGSPRPADGTVLTACQQACPADAITFGDLTDSGSIVSLTKANERNYVMLEELNVRPRTSYLAKLTNPHPELESQVAVTAKH